MDPPRYRYKPIQQADEIRVLKLNTTTTRIEARILHVPVASFGYCALSYVWGNLEQANKAIVFDELGEEVGWIPLTQNLSYAICDLRDAEELKNEFFWIDQICINQQDEKEKNQQVAMMSQIYTQAKQVITYLGPAGIEEDEQRGMRLLERIRRDIPNATWERMHEAGSLERIQDLVLEDSIRLEPLPLDLQLTDEEPYDEDELLRRYTEQGWDWLVRVAYGEWTQRLWIVQEQLLNKQIIGLRGRRLIDWDAITAISILFAICHLPQQYRDTCPKSLAGHVPWDEVERTIYGIWWDRRAHFGTGTDYSWSSLCHNLQWYQSLLCGDPRDRVYGILAISHDSTALGLTPDYSPLNTADNLSKQLSTRVLETAINLEFLSFSLSWRRPDSTLPSWCLGLDRPANLNTPANVPVEVYTPHPISHRSNAARFLTSNSILTVKGRILDRVPTRSPAIAWIGDTSSDPPQISFLYSLLHAVPDNLPIGDIARILRTVTARAPWSPPTAQTSEDDAIAFHFWVYLRHLLRVLAEHTDTLPSSATTMFERGNRLLTAVRALAPCNAYPESQITDEISSEEDIALDRVLDHALDEGRCLGRTDAGSFFNAVHTIEAGDAIIALQGADQLFIIRLVEGTYRLIGDVFVDGIMHGEAYKDLDPDAVDYDIELA